MLTQPTLPALHPIVRLKNVYEGFNRVSHTPEVIERANTLASEVLAELGKIPGMTKVEVHTEHGVTRVKLYYRNLIIPWRFRIFNTEGKTSLSVAVNKREFRSRLSYLDNKEEEFTVYASANGRDASAVSVAKKAQKILEEGYSEWVVEVDENTKRKARETFAAKMTGEGFKVGAGWDSGYELTIPVGDEEKLRKIQEFLKTLGLQPHGLDRRSCPR